MAAARLNRGTAILAGSAFALALLIAFEAVRDLKASGSFFGPALFPFVVTASLFAVGGVLLKQAFAAASEAPGDPIDLPPVAKICGALLAQILLLETLGWIIATALMFAVTAHAFGSRRIGRDGLIGLALAATTYLAFNHLLDLNLPAGAVFRGLLT